MLDLGWTELMLIAVVAVIVLGPKELPNALRTLGQWMRKARRLAGDFQKHLDDIVRESDLDDVRREVNRISSTDIGREIDKAVDPDGDLSRKLKDDDKVKPTSPAVVKTASPAGVKAADPAVVKAESTAVSEPVKPAEKKQAPAKSKPVKKVESAEAAVRTGKKKASSAVSKPADGA